MGNSEINPNSTFTPQARTLGIAAAWIGFAVCEIYEITSGVAYATQGSAVESGPLLAVMALFVVLMGPFLVLSMVAVHAYAAPQHKAIQPGSPGFHDLLRHHHLLHQLSAADGEQSAGSVFRSPGAHCSCRAGGLFPRSSWIISSGIGSLGYRCCWRHPSLAETFSKTRCVM